MIMMLLPCSRRASKALCIIIGPTSRLHHLLTDFIRHCDISNRPWPLQRALELLRGQGAVLVEGDFLEGHEPWMLDAKVGQPIRAYEILREAARWGWEHGSRRSVVDLVEGFPGAPADKAMLQAALSGDAKQGAVPAWVYREALLIHRPRLQEAFADYFRRHGVECILYPTTPMPTRPVSAEGKVHLNGADVPAYATYVSQPAAATWSCSIARLHFAKDFLQR